MSTDDYDYMSDSDLDNAEDDVTEHSKKPATEQGMSCTRPVTEVDIPAPVLESGMRSEPSSKHLEYQSKCKKPYDPPECSPKSMYRFAHLCGIDELKKEAVNDLTSKLTSSNIWIELFESSLTTRYPEVQEIGLEPEVLGALPQWLTRLASGELGPQSGDVVAKLIQKIA